MLATIKRTGILMAMLLTVGTACAQHRHWHRHRHINTNRIVTVVVRPNTTYHVSNRLNQKERMNMALAYLRTNEYLTIKQYAQITQLSKATAEAELDAFTMDKNIPIQMVIKGKKKVYTKI